MTILYYTLDISMLRSFQLERDKDRCILVLTAQVDRSRVP